MSGSDQVGACDLGPGSGFKIGTFTTLLVLSVVSRLFRHSVSFAYLRNKQRCWKKSVCNLVKIVISWFCTTILVFTFYNQCRILDCLDVNV